MKNAKNVTHSASNQCRPRESNNSCNNSHGNMSLVRKLPLKIWATKLGCKAGHLCGWGVRSEDWKFATAHPPQNPTNIGEACQKFFRHTLLIHWLVSVTSSSPIPTAKHTHSSHINSSRWKHIKYWAGEGSNYWFTKVQPQEHICLQICSLKTHR